MELSKYVACICEGAAEQAVIEMLLDEDKLIFTYDDLLEGEVIRCRSAESFEKQYLRKGFDGKITVLRILDSRSENFKLSKAYLHKIIPTAIRCFLESEDYESFLRTVFSFNCDVDTLCAIGGGIAEEFYHGTGLDEDKLLKKYLDENLYEILKF